MTFSALPYALGQGDRQATIRAAATDFVVEEQLPFTPDGTGSHVWLFIQKTETNTDWLAQKIARFAGVSPVAVGYAGLKDRHAVTSQWFSVNLQGKTEPDWQQMNSDTIKVQHIVRHSKKLKRGVLSGNQFRLNLTNVTGNRQAWLNSLETIAKTGVPNYFAEQRFGHQGRNLTQVDAWFHGGEAPRKRQSRSMWISAARSWLFNLVLAERIRQDNWQQALPGDVMLLDGTRASYFVCQGPDATIEQRLAKMDIHPTGPLWGAGESPVEHEAQILEQNVLADWSVWCQNLAELGLKQERRSLRLFPQNFQWQFLTENRLLIEFALPPGSYATAVLRELALITDAAGSKIAE
ncbi:tRNA pseudouridine 13 synthase [Methylophaga frappieri]|uniref:tRNA pseudouridine synthase D n=1 Tax=Methylophaga frappieri (strain ATCC BAA-2434 / DSM 25690 / JAM7) TaxID=754477 RepID=I1YEX1_METFJ|nr:tRNA pseudouridine(13) synthase TruD [Methylophaga frappieri]AFJ01464.1 tRNA pseudouridine 13 synthase [Methylophaga frappieri]